MADSVLSVQGLTAAFDTDRGRLRAVHDVSFDLPRGQTLAIVGESGCGKSVTALSVLGLLPVPPAVIEAGQILYDGKNLLELKEREMRKIRGGKIAMIFQEPMTSLNPVYTVGSQIVEAVRLHKPLSRAAARARAIEMLKLVGIPSPEDRVDAYPHQLSGGMRQRVMIAMALSCDPDVLIADEPTTALDVTIQAQILDLLRRLQAELAMSVLFITHDLGVVAEFSNNVVVMYAGRVVESGSVEEVFAAPEHPYTRGLLASVPPLAASRGAAKQARLQTIEGVVPDLLSLPSGCRFAARCAHKKSEPPGFEACDSDEPALFSLGPGRASRCHYSQP
ncbi:MAG TPA: ABC transporter ATP-binding protein [Polyangiaceae bacterium]|nr:ABC transporter ATP-binding protein [Polyangiaceae bacterium]